MCRGPGNSRNSINIMNILCVSSMFADMCISRYVVAYVRTPSVCASFSSTSNFHTYALSFRSF